MPMVLPSWKVVETLQMQVGVHPTLFVVSIHGAVDLCILELKVLRRGIIYLSANGIFPKVIKSSTNKQKKYQNDLLKPPTHHSRPGNLVADRSC